MENKQENNKEQNAEERMPFHVVTAIRTYLGISQVELGKRAGVSPCDINELENHPPFGWALKYQRLSKYLGIPVEALVKNDFRLIPETFFLKHQPPEYLPMPTVKRHMLGRMGEEYILEREKARLRRDYPALAKLVTPCFKMNNSAGYDILSFDGEGKPYCIEVKTSKGEARAFRLSRNELSVADRMTERGVRYVVCCISYWEQ